MDDVSSCLDPTSRLPTGQVSALCGFFRGWGHFVWATMFPYKAFFENFTGCISFCGSLVATVAVAEGTKA